MTDTRVQSQRQGKWRQFEDELLKKAVNLYGEKQWRIISQHVPGRTPIQCLHRWSKILKPGLVKGPWSSQEDKLLRDWVDREGPCKWSQCALNIPGRNGKQCRERWYNILNPAVKKGDWQDEEDKLILQLFQAYGPKWTKISKHLPGRTENSIKNRYYSSIRKELAPSEQIPVKYEEENLGQRDPIDFKMLALLQRLQQLEEYLHTTRRDIMILENQLNKKDDISSISEVQLNLFK